MHRYQYQSTGFSSASLVKNTKQLIYNSLQSSVNIDGKALYYKINGIAYVSNSIEFLYTEITSPGLALFDLCLIARPIDIKVDIRSKYLRCN